MANANSEAITVLGNKLPEKVKNASSLEVTSFSGEFKIKGNTLKSDIDAVLNQIKNSTVEAELNMAAYSIMKLNTEEAELVKSHREMIEASQNSRKIFADMLFRLTGKA